MKRHAFLILFAFITLSIITVLLQGCSEEEPKSARLSIWMDTKYLWCGGLVDGDIRSVEVWVDGTSLGQIKKYMQKPSSCIPVDLLTTDLAQGLHKITFKESCTNAMVEKEINVNTECFIYEIVPE